MRLYIDISINTYNKIKDYIEAGKYPTLSDFFAIAAENQLMLEKIHDNIPFDRIIPLSKETSKIETTVISEEKFLKGFKKDLVKTKDMPKIEQLLYPDAKSEDECYLWGQINRIFPIKLGLRVLGNMLLEKKTDYIDLIDYQKTTARIALSLRKTMEALKEEKNTKELLWAGLPDSKPDKINKSLDRFKNQFLGYLRRDGIIEGALGRLKFANIWTEDKRVCIGITNAGLEFAMLENPILDNGEYNLGSLGDAEKAFYIKHIVKYVPSEPKMFGDILNLIKAGTSDLTSLNKKLSDIWPNDWTPAVVNTYRSGTTARLVELGFIEKVKNGIEVEYKITKSGVNFIDKFNNIRG